MLIEFIKQNGGTVSIESFMQAALYHPVYGYYSRGIRGLGRKGDFSTSATFHPALGQAISRWLVGNRKRLSPGKNWNVIEVGGGDGSLARVVLENISWWQRKKLQFHLVELSDSLRQQQQEQLKDYRVVWHDSMEKAIAAAQWSALIFTNELVDAFPCVQFIREDGLWKEVCLTLRDDQLFEENREDTSNLERAAGSTLFSGEQLFKDGQRCEVHASYRDWLTSWLPKWQRGLLLTIDYGDLFPDLYHRRYHGTLRGYYQHTRMEGHGVYQRFGKQDLTADVNFSDLIHWGEELGIKKCTFTTQREFILKWRPDFSKREIEDPSLAFILHPDGLGVDFKVLVQEPAA